MLQLNQKSDYWNFNTGNMNNVPAYPVNIGDGLNPPTAKIQPLRDLGTQGGWELLIYEDYAFLWEAFFERVCHNLQINNFLNWDQIVTHQVPYSSLKGPYRSDRSSLYDLYMNYSIYMANNNSNGYTINKTLVMECEQQRWDPAAHRQTDVDNLEEQRYFDNIIQNYVAPTSYINWFNQKYPNNLYTMTANPATLDYVHKVRQTRILYYDMNMSNRFLPNPKTKLYFDFNFFYYGVTVVAGSGYQRPQRYEIKHYKLDDHLDNHGLIESTLQDGFTFPTLRDITESDPHLPYIENQKTLWMLRFCDCGSEAGDVNYHYFTMIWDRFNYQFGYLYAELECDTDQVIGVAHLQFIHTWRDSDNVSHTTYQNGHCEFGLHNAVDDRTIVDPNNHNKRYRSLCISRKDKNKVIWEGFAGEDSGLFSWDPVSFLREHGYKIGRNQNIDLPLTTINTEPDVVNPLFRESVLTRPPRDKLDPTYSRHETFELRLISMDVVYRQKCRSDFETVGWTWDPINGF